MPADWGSLLQKLHQGLVDVLRRRGRRQGQLTLPHLLPPLAVGQERDCLVVEPRAGGVLLSMSSAPPRSASTRAFLYWWLSVTLGEGTRMAGVPVAVSSLKVDAPARHSTRSAAAMTVGIS